MNIISDTLDIPTQRSRYPGVRRHGEINLSWDAIGALGEVVAAVAVVISLAYLAIQIRTQNAESRAAAIHEISAGWRAASEQFTDGELAAIFIKANLDFDSLTDTEALQLVAGVHGIFRVYEEAFHQNQANRLDHNIWAGMNRQYSSYLAAPAFQRYWEMRGYQYSDDFQEYVDKLEPTTWDVR